MKKHKAYLFASLFKVAKRDENKADERVFHHWTQDNLYNSNTKVSVFSFCVCRVFVVNLNTLKSRPQHQMTNKNNIFLAVWKYRLFFKPSGYCHVHKSVFFFSFLLLIYLFYTVENHFLPVLFYLLEKKIMVKLRKRSNCVNICSL